MTCFNITASKATQARINRANEIAETKVAQVMGIANQQQHPLLCTMEES